MKNLVSAGLLSVSLSMSAAASSCYQGDTAFPNEVSLQGYSQPAVLNGYGSRTKLVFDVYFAALYLPARTHNPEQAMGLDGPISINIQFAHQVPAEKLIEGWQDGFNLNNSDAELAQLQQRLEDSYQYFRDMQPGDNIRIDRHPELGSQLWINGEHQLNIPGDDYFKAVMKIWLGQNPAQGVLKRCLLGSDLS